MAYRINQYAILFHKKIKKKGPSSQMTLSNQNLNYEKIYVFRIANVKLVFELCKYICDKILYLTYF